MYLQDGLITIKEYTDMLRADIVHAIYTVNAAARKIYDAFPNYSINSVFRIISKENARIRRLIYFLTRVLHYFISNSIILLCLNYILKRGKGPYLHDLFGAAIKSVSEYYLYSAQEKIASIGRFKSYTWL